MKLDPGTVVDERFEIEWKAGSGAMGAVYKATDRMTGGKIALKVLNQEGRDPIARFEREADILSQLEHPGILRHLAHGVTAEGRLYLATEWLEGEVLEDRMSGQGLTISESLSLVGKIAEALAAAHEHGVIHRDVKPTNVFLVDGRVDRAKLLDFGLARGGETPNALTRTGMTVGTPAYMAPEQARGEHGLDGRVDIFSLGCLLFECISGQLPFLGEHVVAVLAKILFDETPRLREVRPDVPIELDELVACMMAKDRRDRPRDANVVVEALAKIRIEDELAPARAHPKSPELG